MVDSTGTVWNVGGGGAAGYKLTANPLAPKLLGTTGSAGRNPSPYNDFILHNSQRRGKTLLVTEADYIDTDEVPPARPRQVRDVESREPGQGRAPVPNTWFGSPTADSVAFQPHPAFGFVCTIRKPDLDTP